MTAPTGTVYRAALLVACWATAFGGLAGCSEEPGRAGTLPSRTASPTPTTTSASPTPTTVEEQVEAAVRAYFAEVTHAAETNDTSRLRHLSTKGCPCYGYVRSFDKLRRQGKYLEGAVWTVDEIRVHDRIGDTALAEVRYTVSPYVARDKNARVLRRFDQQSRHLDFSMVRTEQGWIVGNTFDLEG